MSVHGTPFDVGAVLILPNYDRFRALTAELGLAHKVVRMPSVTTGVRIDGERWLDASRMAAQVGGRLAVLRGLAHAPMKRPEQLRTAADLYRWATGHEPLVQILDTVYQSAFFDGLEDIPHQSIDGWGMAGDMVALGAGALLGFAERMFKGGQEGLIDALADGVRAAGGQLHTGSPVQAVEPGGLRVSGAHRPFDRVLLANPPAPATHAHLGALPTPRLLSASVIVELDAPPDSPLDAPFAVLMDRPRPNEALDVLCMYHPATAQGVLDPRCLLLYPRLRAGGPELLTAERLEAALRARYPVAMGQRRVRRVLHTSIWPRGAGQVAERALLQRVEDHQGQDARFYTGGWERGGMSNMNFAIASGEQVAQRVLESLP